MGLVSDGEQTWARDERRVDWQREGKNRAAAALACNIQRAAVRLDNSLRNWQSHSGSLDRVALVLSAIHFVKNQVLFVNVNPVALIDHADHHEISAYLDHDGNRLLGWRILACIFQQLRQGLFDESQVRTRSWQPRRDLHLN